VNYLFWVWRKSVFYFKLKKNEGPTMQSIDQVQDMPQADTCQEAWMGLLKTNCDALFQIALLLSADPETAEASIVAGIDSLDMSGPPEKEQLAILQKAVAMRAIEGGHMIGSPDSAEARSILQTGLWPVLQIDRFPRACFVLRMLLGYATSSCGQMLGIDDGAVRTFVRIAIMQLHRAVMGSEAASVCVAGTAAL
jgi:hypothetical protein